MSRRKEEGEAEGDVMGTNGEGQEVDRVDCTRKDVYIVMNLFIVLLFNVFCVYTHAGPATGAGCQGRGWRPERAAGGRQGAGAITAEGLRPCSRITGRQMGTPREAQRLADGPQLQKG